MKSSRDQSQQFITTLILGIIVAALLASAVLAMLYGCMRAVNGRPALPKAELQTQSVVRG